jgi:hypothetical protein
LKEEAAEVAEAATKDETNLTVRSSHRCLSAVAIEETTKDVVDSLAGVVKAQMNTKFLNPVNTRNAVVVGLTVVAKEAVEWPEETNKTHTGVQIIIIRSDPVISQTSSKTRTSPGKTKENTTVQFVHVAAEE